MHWSYILLCSLLINGYNDYLWESVWKGVIRWFLCLLLLFSMKRDYDDFYIDLFLYRFVSIISNLIINVNIF